MKYLTTSTILRIITATLLLVALTKQPYDFYTLLRLATCFTSAYLIFVAVTTKNFVWIVLFSFLIVLFNPIKLFPIRRATWAIIDVVTAFLMLGSILLLRENIRTAKPKTSE
jgi:hypothetical protein